MTAPVAIAVVATGVAKTVPPPPPPRREGVTSAMPMTTGAHHVSPPPPPQPPTTNEATNVATAAAEARKPPPPSIATTTAGPSAEARKPPPPLLSGDSRSSEQLRASFHSQSSEQNIEAIAAVTTQSKALTEDEGAEFKRFCSMSLSELDRDLVVGGSSARRSLDGANDGRTRKGSFTGGSEFKPRPVRVSQFEDGDDQCATPRGRTKQVVTTASFVNAVHPKSGGHQPSNPSAKVCVDRLPNTVDRKGRCTKHPNVKLFKKKLLGGYEMVRAHCPSCAEEAPYEELWRERAKHRRGASRERDGVRRSASRERSGSFDSMSKSKPRLRSASDDAVSRGSVGRKSLGVARPPPPSTRSAHDLDIPSPLLHRQGARPAPPPRRRRSSPFDPRRRARSLSAGRPPRREKTSTDKSQPEEQALNASQNRSFFDMSMDKLTSGMDKVSSLPSRARSSPRHKQRGSADWTHVTSVSEKGSKMSPTAAKKNAVRPKFDTKTGRCKKHPSVLMAKKSRFNRGWDVLKDTCPYCSKGKAAPMEEDSPEFSEISKKKMEALLHGRNAGVDGPNCQSFLSRDRNNACGAKSRTANRAPQTQSGTGRVSRMPYTTPWGEAGWYSGEVDSSRRPHGEGRMRYKTGKHYEGEWIDGYSSEFLENQDRMRSGFGTNVAKWKETERSKVPNPGYPGQYQTAPPQAAYAYGVAVPYNTQVVTMVPAAGMYGQTPGYQWAAQSPGGQGNLPSPGCHQ
ncbi:hypothetical protein ACHAXT_007921 [Thalassiosira profunda]